MKLNNKRRDFLTSGTGFVVVALAASSGVSPAQAQNAPGWNKSAFDAHSLADVAKAMGVAGVPVESRDVLLQAPEIAENGSVVRVSAQSNLPNTSQILLVVEKNPSALAAVFDIPADTDAHVLTNIKMGQSSHVYALARVGDRLFYAVREVRVTLGGCGA